MAAHDKIKMLQDITFFQDVSGAYLGALASMCREVDFPARATIFEEYERAKEVYFILEGPISLARDLRRRRLPPDCRPGQGRSPGMVAAHRPNPTVRHGPNSDGGEGRCLRCRRTASLLQGQHCFWIRVHAPRCSGVG